jgi:hypothetical protein
MPKYSLKFELQPRKSQELLLGNLHLVRDGLIANTYMCTSSLRGRQFSGSWELKGGLIPPGAYQVATDPLWMPDTKGVEGSFYQITPFEVQTDGATRGDFGIHFDANIPGSLGCVVLTTQRGWDAFRRDVKLIAAQAVRSLNLLVQYNQPH